MAISTSWSHWWTISIALLVSSILAGTAAPAQTLRPARAVYDLHLNKDRENAGIVAAKGRLVVEFSEDCAGFIFNQGFVSRITATEGRDIVGDMQASIWESRDGRALRFNLVNRINGKVVEREQGRANLDSGGGGDAVWSLPKARRLALPKGTLFPVSHNREVLRRALQGSRGFEVPLFDGSNDAGYYHASVFIGAQVKNGAERATKSAPVPKDQPSWPVRLAYYHYDNALGVPEFEIGYTLYGDGTIAAVKLDYPDFGLIGKLVELQYLEQPDCD